VSGASLRLPKAGSPERLLVADLWLLVILGYELRAFAATRAAQALAPREGATAPQAGCAVSKVQLDFTKKCFLTHVIFHLSSVI
jgi:hypothetical protein